MKIFLTAGEASGDRLGAAFLDGLKSLRPDLSLHGVGGPLMAQQGLTSLFDMNELSVMGLAEILPRYFDLKRRIQKTADAVLQIKPDVLVTIDAPEFSLRVAKIVKAQSDIPTVHYVAPTVWAWRPGRADKMAKYIDHVLALFPFEPPFMESAGMSCDFVGHPIATEPSVTKDEITTFKENHGLTSQPTFLLLPGSRRSEVDRLFPIFRKVIEDQRFKGMQVIVPTLEHLRSRLESHVKTMRNPPKILGPEAGAAPDQVANMRRIAFAASDVALAASGTVSLELASVGTPMVIGYDMHWLSRQIIGRMLKVDTVTLVNLVAENRTVPEFIGAKCVPGKLSDAVASVIHDPAAQKSAMRKTMKRLGQGELNPGLRAAQSVLDRFSL